MSPDALRQVGEALYGERWQSPLARDLGVTPRTVRRWVAGDTAPDASVGPALLALVRQRGALLASIKTIPAGSYRLAP